ncbi:hypothetical protein At1D1460_48440 (plasmid) [Agrobacterium tumefaciens]|nr:hypothetical protein At1D1460_48440 [Agrobacterium tumefaciens]
MVAPRANWGGFIKFGVVACPVALYTAASSSERIAFNTLNRKTGNRVKRQRADIGCHVHCVVERRVPRIPLAERD